MSIRFDCPNCKANYEVADDLGGKMIMCRLCKKRGLVKSATGTAPSSLVKSSTPAPSRRNFLLIGSGVVASLGAIGTGALLARWRPWRHWGADEEGRRRRRGGPPGGPPPGDRKDRDKGPST